MGMRIRWLWVAAAVSIVPLALAACVDQTGAGATGNAPTVSMPDAGHAVQAVDNRADAGYLDESTGETSVTGTIVLPTFTCTTGVVNTFDATVQLEVSPPDANESAVGYVYANCSGSGDTPTYTTQTCDNNATCTTLASVSAGDKITMTETLTSSQSTSKLVDDTTKAVAVEEGPGGGVVSNANFLVQREWPTIPTFDDLVFSRCLVNGAPFGGGDLDETKTMTNSSGQIQVAVGDPNASGNGFGVKFNHT